MGQGDTWPFDLSIGVSDRLHDLDGDLRNDGIAERFQSASSVHPSGNPISHSTKRGCNFKPSLLPPVA